MQVGWVCIHACMHFRALFFVDLPPSRLILFAVCSRKTTLLLPSSPPCPAKMDSSCQVSRRPQAHLRNRSHPVDISKELLEEIETGKSFHLPSTSATR